MDGWSWVVNRLRSSSILTFDTAHRLKSSCSSSIDVVFCTVSEIWRVTPCELAATDSFSVAFRQELRSLCRILTASQAKKEAP